MSCGCDSRREVIFTYGNVGVTEAVIMGLAVFAVVSTTIYRYRKGSS